LKVNIPAAKHHLEAAIFTFGALTSFLFYYYVIDAGPFIDPYGSGALPLLLTTYCFSFLCSYAPKSKSIFWNLAYIWAVYYVSHATAIVLTYLVTTSSADLVYKVKAGIALYYQLFIVEMAFMFPAFFLVFYLMYFLILRKPAVDKHIEL
jgi:hypothetical protein